MKISITPPKSLMTAVGVKNRPSAMIFRLSSMLMNITNTYSPIWNRHHDYSDICPFMNRLVSTCDRRSIWIVIPAEWGRAWPWWRVIRTSWRCRSRWSPQSSPSPDRWLSPEDHCEAKHISRNRWACFIKQMWFFFYLTVIQHADVT